MIDLPENDAIAHPNREQPTTYLSENEAHRWAWQQVKKDCGLEGASIGETCSFQAFFCYGWCYRGQYEAQRAPESFEQWLDQTSGFTRHDEAIARAAWQAALSAPKPAAAWLPIETAPKDGTVIDLWADKRRITSCYWGLPSHCCGEAGSYCDSEWHDLKDGWVDDMNEPLGEYRGQPTHWMPLPSAPIATKEPS